MAFWSAIAEASEISFPRQFDIADRAVSLFRNDDFRLPRKLRPLVTSVIILLAVHEHHNVRILLDRTRLSEVAEAWAMIFTVFGLAI